MPAHPFRTLLTHAATLATAAGAVLASAPVLAADLLIDDFSTGSYRSPAFKSGWFVPAPQQSGSMLGGFRDTTIALCDPKVKGDCAARNPYGLTASYAILPARGSVGSAFVASAGYQTPPRMEIAYGLGAGGMSADLSGGPDRRLRFSFSGLTQPLNFNVVLFTGAGRGQDGCNINELNRPFVLEMPLSEFTMVNGGFDAAAISLMDVIFQSGSAIGGVQFALNRIEVVDQPLAGAIHCGPLGT